MAQIGTIVTTQETPPAVSNSNNTANAFMVGFADWGPVGASGVNTAYSSLSQVSGGIGPPNGGLIQNSRTATDATLYDSADVFFREGGSNVYVSRVVGPAPTFGKLTLATAVASIGAINLTAAYPGSGSSAINVVITATGSVYTATLQDGSGNILNTSPTLTSAASAHTDFVTWAATTNLITAVGSVAGSPAALTATPLTAGTDDRANATITHWSNALGGFSSLLGPGQVFAPNQTNTSLAGIWSALATHAQNNNRIALLDGTDGNSATSAIAEVTTAALPSAVQSYCGIWAGSLKIPGIVSGTTRTVAPSPVIAALCARADNNGNPNQAAAGTSFPFNYVSSLSTTYTNPLTGDISNLNDHGINVFAVQYNVLQNFGFVSALAVPTNDAIYWQLNHGRTRMAIVDQAQVVAQPYQFSQIDGQFQTISAFGGTLTGMLLSFFNVGALFGDSAADAFTVDVGPAVNNNASLANGILAANLAVRMSPFAQLVQIMINAVPITQNLTPISL